MASANQEISSKDSEFYQIVMRESIRHSTFEEKGVRPDESILKGIRTSKYVRSNEDGRVYIGLEAFLIKCNQSLDGCNHKAFKEYTKKLFKGTLLPVVLKDDLKEDVLDRIQ